MSTEAFQIQYRQEFVHGFEQKQSLLRDCVTTEAVIRGNRATFLVADSGNSTTRTRGSNGLIPARANNKEQFTATLTEEHDLVTESNFDIFASQGDQREIMQRTTMAVVNRKMDQQIIDALTTGTQDISSSAVTGSVRIFGHARAILGNNDVPNDGNITFLASPAFMTYLLEAPEFSSADYVSNRPFQGSGSDFTDKPAYYMWRGVKVVEHPNLPGAGTASETCFMFHRSAIGHAVGTEAMDMVVGYDQEQDYSYARYSAYMGAVLMQNTGVVLIPHDGSAFAAV